MFKSKKKDICPAPSPDVNWCPNCEDWYTGQRGCPTCAIQRAAVRGQAREKHEATVRQLKKDSKKGIALFVAGLLIVSLGVLGAWRYVGEQTSGPGKVNSTDGMCLQVRLWVQDAWRGEPDLARLDELDKAAKNLPENSEKVKKWAERTKEELAEGATGASVDARELSDICSKTWTPR